MKRLTEIRNRAFSFAHKKPVMVVLASIGVLVVGYLGYMYFILTPRLANADFGTVLPVNSKIVDRNGELLYEIGGPMQRTIAPSEEIPQMLKYAAVAAEDREFYNHVGIDLKGILRAAVVNVKAGGVVQGGSTITQQLVKNTLLTNDRTFERKIKEALLALMIESRMSKDEIITAYLNSIGYGSNIVGVQKASEIFFGKQPKDLSLEEVATLAALPQAPSQLSPYNGDREALDARRDQILTQLQEKKYINADQASTAINAEVAVKPMQHSIAAPHFSLMIKEWLIQEYGKKKVEEGGLIVTTTLDKNLQDEVDAIIQKHRGRIGSYGAKNAAAVVIDPKTGELLALVGNTDYYDTSIDGQVNIAVSARQPGSSFKPIVYSTLFTKNAYSPASIMRDQKRNFGTPARPWTPSNYTGTNFNLISVRNALAGSLNIPAVEAASITGVDSIIDVAEALGYSTLEDRSRFGLAIALGAAEVKPIEHTAAFAALANQGVYNPTTTILSIADPKGKVIYKKTSAPRQVLPEEVAFQISDILSDNDARKYIFGSNSSIAFPGRQVAAKSGTTQNWQDAWTMGYTTSRAVGVWVGNSDGKLMRAGADGTVVAGPIFREIITKAMEMGHLQFEDFKPTPTMQQVRISTARGTVTEYLAPWQIESANRLALAHLRNEPRPAPQTGEGVIPPPAPDETQQPPNPNDGKKNEGDQGNDGDDEELPDIGGSPEPEPDDSQPITPVIAF